MASFTRNPEVINRVGAQQNVTFRGRYEMQRRNTTLVKTNSSNTISLFDIVGS